MKFFMGPHSQDLGSHHVPFSFNCQQDDAEVTQLINLLFLCQGRETRYTNNSIASKY